MQRTIPLRVPPGSERDAFLTGALLENGAWRCSPDNEEALSIFAPRLVPRLVPKTAWGKNLRSLFPDEWDEVRNAAYAKAGGRCRICVDGAACEAHEDWRYDDRSRTFKLNDVIALCSDCHGAVHFGKAEVDGRQEAAYTKLMEVNHWSRPVAEEAVVAAKALWMERSRHEWTGDYEWARREHGLHVDQAALDRADEANRIIVARATGRSIGTTVPHDERARRRTAPVR